MSQRKWHDFFQITAGQFLFNIQSKLSSQHKQTNNTRIAYIAVFDCWPVHINTTSKAGLYVQTIDYVITSMKLISGFATCC
jgi:hypothetical protein